jgi:aspartate racemase
MSWESTQTYYRLINQAVAQRLGGLHSARIVLVSVDFAQMEQLQRAGDWAGAADALSLAAKQIEAAGADLLLICTNTMHKVAAEIEAAVRIPLLHIADATGRLLTAQGLHTVGLLGTAFTMEQDFYTGRLRERYGVQTLTPDAAMRARVHQVIFDELCRGTLSQESREDYLRIIDRLVERGAQAVILGCTEIGLLVRASDTSVTLFDTTEIHAARAVDVALGTAE